MSRSYKHTPYSGDRKSKFFKNYANRVVRRKKLEHDLKYNAYKKLYCSYDICDYYWIETTNFELYYKSCIEQWQNWVCRGLSTIDEKPTRRQCWKEYKKWYINK